MSDFSAKRDTWWCILFAAGIVLSVIMVMRVGIGYDAADLLARGWLLAEKGVWVPLGNPVTGGGYVPGGLTSLLVGAPLALWMDHRAPVILVLLFHLAAYLILDRLIARTLGRRARIAFAIIYWLNPWRLYQSGWLDNSNYTFLTGAVHAWGCYYQRHRPRFLHSAILVAAVGLSVQLHLNAAILVFASIPLWLRGYWKPHWGGVALGVVISFAALVPFFIELYQNPDIYPGRYNDSLPGIVVVWPVLKGISYWFRYASLWCSSKSMLVFDFVQFLSPASSESLAKFFGALGVVAGTATIVLAFLANTWLWTRMREQPKQKAAVKISGRTWIKAYTVWIFVGCIIANALSTAHVMWWHNLIALHGAVLPVVLWTDALLRTPKAFLVRSVMAVYAIVAVVLMVGMGFGSEQYQGRRPPPEPFVAEHELIRDLNLYEYTLSSLPRTNLYFYRQYLRPYEIVTKTVN